MKTLIVLVVFSLIQISEAKASKACEPITVPRCVEVSWNMTSYPNFLGHLSQREAAPFVHEFMPLMQAGCYRYMKEFICSVYVPKCDQETRELVLPCHNFCRAARSGCRSLLEKFNFKWPEAFRCSKFPKTDCLPMPNKGNSLDVLPGPIDDQEEPVTELPVVQTVSTIRPGTEQQLVMQDCTCTCKVAKTSHYKP